MFNKSGTCLLRVRTLLDNIEYLRDNKRDTIKQFRFYFPTDNSSEESIARNWRLIQQYIPELR